MKTLLWIVTALLLAFWTGAVALVHQLTGWLLGAIDSGALSQAAGAVDSLPLPTVPGWVEPWFDASALQSLQEFTVGLVQWLGAVLPSGDSLMAWIGPLLWIGWGLGTFTLLAVAALVHWLIGRGKPPALLQGARA